MEEIILLTNIVSAAIYLIIFTIILMVGYIARATALYNKALEENRYTVASFAWYPFASVITMAKLANTSYLFALITTIIWSVGVIASIVIMVLSGSVIAWLIYLCIALYIVYSVAHFRLLKKYMNIFSPDVSNVYIAFSSFVPLFKYLIHIEV